MSTLLVSVDTLRRRSRLTFAMDPDIVRPSIETAQRLHILPALGAGLYDQIIADVDASTLTGAYQTLVETYLTPALIHWVLAEGIEDWHFRIEGSGIVIRNTDNGQAAPSSDVARIRNREKQRAQQETIRMIDYIRDNISSFPEYGQEGAVHGNLKPMKEPEYYGSHVYVTRGLRSRPLDQRGKYGDALFGD